MAKTVDDAVCRDVDGGWVWSYCNRRPPIPARSYAIEPRRTHFPGTTTKTCDVSCVMSPLSGRCQQPPQLRIWLSAGPLCALLS